MKKYINQMLGNSLRCILPSYWWKNILGKMADAIESAKSAASSASQTANRIQMQFDSKQNTLISGSNIKKINGNDILGSGDLVLDTWKLEKYATEEELKEQKHLDGGEIASVVDESSVESSFKDCYFPSRSEYNTSTNNKKYTKIKSITVNPVLSVVPRDRQFEIELVGKYGTINKLNIDFRCYNEQPELVVYKFNGGSSGVGDYIYYNNKIQEGNLSNINNILSEGDFKLINITWYGPASSSGGYYVNDTLDNDIPSDDVFNVMDNTIKFLKPKTNNADIYLKSANWEKLAKDSRVTELETRIEELLTRVAALEGTTPTE